MAGKNSHSSKIQTMHIARNLSSYLQQHTKKDRHTESNTVLKTPVLFIFKRPVPLQLLKVRPVTKTLHLGTVAVTLSTGWMDDLG